MSGLTYGGDKCIFGWHADSSATATWHPQKTFTVSNTGVIGSDTTNPTDSYREACVGTGYGGDKGIVLYGWGYTSYDSSSFYPRGGTNSDGRANLISNTGIVASETACAGTRKHMGSGGEYGGDKAIISYGYLGSNTLTNQINTISNTGVVSSDTTGVGTARIKPAYTRYGSDKGIFFSGGHGYYQEYQFYNLVSNTGVVATNTSMTNDARFQSIGCGYGS